MTVVRPSHERLDAVFETVDGRELPAHYGRPARTVRAVRNGVGVTEMAYGAIAVTGGDRVDFVDNAVSNAVPTTDGRGCYALLLDPQGGIRADLYVYTAADRLLVFTPPAMAGDLVEGWAARTFVQDVEVADVTETLGIFGVHGPKATEKIASVLNGASAPDEVLTFVRGRMNDEGVTVIRTDAPAGEESFEVVVRVDAEGNDTQDRDDGDAPSGGDPTAHEGEDGTAPGAVFDALVTYGLNAVPFGRRTWQTLTLEAGTPLFETELAGTVPNVLGVRNALDFEKGCYVGQEVVARVENVGRPSRRLVGLRCDALPDAGAKVLDSAAGGGKETGGDGHGTSIGTVTRAVDSPTVDAPIALALVTYDATPAAVRVDGEPVSAAPVALPFVEGSERSGRLPAYPGDAEAADSAATTED